jgi:uncharacterized oxidoreductase
MKTTGSTIFITGGGSGIGRGLAEAFHKSGNKVIIGGRRRQALAEVCSANPGMESIPLDVQDRNHIRDVARQLAHKFPKLNCVVNNAGIQRAIDFTKDPISFDAIEEEITTNLTGLIHMCAAFLPHLKKQARASLINVSSGLGLMPLALVPVYSATKAAVHSFTRSLRHQLRATTVEVIELIPPSVVSDLRTGRDEAHSGPPSMPLDEYIAETIKGIERGDTEIAVGMAQRGLAAADNEEVRNTFLMMNR